MVRDWRGQKLSRHKHIHSVDDLRPTVANFLFAGLRFRAALVAILRGRRNFSEGEFLVFKTGSTNRSIILSVILRKPAHGAKAPRLGRTRHCGTVALSASFGY